MIKYASLLTGFVICLSLGSAYGMDGTPKEILEHQMLPRLDVETLENFVNTNKGNADAVKKIRENLKIPKKARFSCPSGKEATQAVGMDGSTPIQVTINGIVWDVPAIEPPYVNTRESLEGAKLSFVYIFPPASSPNGQFQEFVMCNYKNNKKGSFFMLQRALKNSDSHLLPHTCKPLDPIYQQQVTIGLSGNYPNAPYGIHPASPEVSFPDGLEIICDQEKN